MSLSLSNRRFIIMFATSAGEEEERRKKKEERFHYFVGRLLRKMYHHTIPRWYARDSFFARDLSGWAIVTSNTQ